MRQRYLPTAHRIMKTNLESRTPAHNESEQMTFLPSLKGSFNKNFIVTLMNYCQAPVSQRQPGLPSCGNKCLPLFRGLY